MAMRQLYTQQDYSKFTYVHFIVEENNEIAFLQLRELALAQHVDDNKISIGVWAKLNGYFKKRRQKDNKVYTIYIKVRNDKCK